MTVPSQTHSCKQKIFLQGGRTKTETEQREKTQPKRQERAKETKSQKERAKYSPKRVASKDQQGEVPGPSFEGVCMSAGEVPNQD